MPTVLKAKYHGPGSQDKEASKDKELIQKCQLLESEVEQLKNQLDQKKKEYNEKIAKLSKFFDEREEELQKDIAEKEQHIEYHMK